MKKICVYTLLVCLTFGCKQSTQNSQKASPTVEREIGFVHAVYFYLVDDISDADRKAFEEALVTLSKVESIVDIKWGPPAGTPREVVDNTYDYAFIPMFEDAAGHDAYQIAPIHRKFVDEFEHLFKEVKIYDNLCK